MAYLTGFAKDLSVSDENYVNKLNELFLMLLSLRLLAYKVAPLDVRERWLRNTLGSEFVRNWSQLFPEDRNILKYSPKSISPEELAVLTAKDPREAAKELLEFLDNLIEKISRKP